VWLLPASRIIPPFRDNDIYPETRPLFTLQAFPVVSDPNVIPNSRSQRLDKGSAA
jgi:hypothetical protein